MTALDPRHVAMANAMAQALKRRLPRNVSIDDLRQAAFIGLLDALGRHPQGDGSGYEWYLRCRIRGSMLDELRKQDWSGRRRGATIVPRVFGFDDLYDQQGFPRQFAVDADSPEDVAIMRCDAAKAWSAPLDPRDKRVMRACYAEQPRRQKEVGRLENVSEARISQRVTRGLAGMRRHLGAER